MNKEPQPFRRGCPHIILALTRAWFEENFAGIIPPVDGPHVIWDKTGQALVGYEDEIEYAYPAIWEAWCRWEANGTASGGDAAGWCRALGLEEE